MLRCLPSLKDIEQYELEKIRDFPEVEFSKDDKDLMENLSCIRKCYNHSYVSDKEKIYVSSQTVMLALKLKGIALCVSEYFSRLKKLQKETNDCDKTIDIIQTKDASNTFFDDWDDYSKNLFFLFFQPGKYNEANLKAKNLLESQTEPEKDPLRTDAFESVIKKFVKSPDTKLEEAARLVKSAINNEVKEGNEIVKRAGWCYGKLEKIFADKLPFIHANDSAEGIARSIFLYLYNKGKLPEIKDLAHGSTGKQAVTMGGVTFDDLFYVSDRLVDKADFEKLGTLTYFDEPFDALNGADGHWKYLYLCNKWGHGNSGSLNIDLIKTMLKNVEEFDYTITCEQVESADASN